MLKKERILAIDPGTREMGVAVFENGHLLYAGVETFRKLPSPRGRLKQARATVERLLGDFRPAILTVEKTFTGKSRKTALLNVLVAQICAVGRRKGIAVQKYAPNTVKKVVAGYGWAKKEEVAHAVARQFPKLTAFLPPDRNWKRRHQLNMFDAVALGIASFSDPSKGRAPPG